MRFYTFKLSTLRRIYYNRHKKLWNEIVKKLNDPKFDPSSISVSGLKVKIYNKLWPKFKSGNNCAACAYKVEKKEQSDTNLTCKYGCLLKTNNVSGSVGSCLDRKYNYFVHSYYYGSRTEAIERAKAIRDLPINQLS